MISKKFAFFQNIDANTISALLLEPWQVKLCGSKPAFAQIEIFRTGYLGLLVENMEYIGNTSFAFIIKFHCEFRGRIKLAGPKDDLLN